MKSNISPISFEHERGMSNITRETPSILTARLNRQNKSDTGIDEDLLSQESMSVCARFDFCSAPKCPLDPLMGLRTEVEDDPKCEMAKATRHKYWTSMKEDLRSLLPFQGYLKTEYNRIRSAKMRWEVIPDYQKKAIIERLKRGGKNVSE